MPSWSSICLAGKCDCSTIQMISSFSEAVYLRVLSAEKGLYFVECPDECTFTAAEMTLGLPEMMKLVVARYALRHQ